MRSSSARKWRLRFLLAALITSSLLAACGGSDGGGGQFAGIEGTGIVSGFGSVYIDGIEFATQDADIVIDGAPALESSLRVGNVVRVLGRIDEGGRAIADRIVFDRTVDGPISEIVLDGNGRGKIIALGQTVRFDGDTVFVNTRAAELAVGDLIAISGLTDGNGTLRATSIEQGAPYTAGATRIDVEGRIRDVDEDSFQLGTLTVNYAAAIVDGNGPALDEGAFVQVFGVRNTADAPLDADSVTRLSLDLGGDSAEIFREGLIDNFSGLADFTVAGQLVDASGARRTDESILAPASGVSVAVRGRNRNGVLVASTYEIQPSPDVMLSARLNTVNIRDNGLELLGTNWTVRGDTLYVDGRSANDDENDRRLRINRLAAGDTVRVHGYMGRDGLIMTRLERIAENASGEAEVRGNIQRIILSNDSSNRIVIAGAETVVRDGTTAFRNAAGETIDAGTFFSDVGVGSVIDVRGPANGNQIDTARSVQLVR